MRFAVEPAEVSAEAGRLFGALPSVVPSATWVGATDWSGPVAAALPGRASPGLARELAELLDETIAGVWRDLAELAHATGVAGTRYQELSAAALDDSNRPAA